MDANAISTKLLAKEARQHITQVIQEVSQSRRQIQQGEERLKLVQDALEAANKDIHALEEAKKTMRATLADLRKAVADGLRDRLEAARRTQDLVNLREDYESRLAATEAALEKATRADEIGQCQQKLMAAEARAAVALSSGVVPSGRDASL